jgi:hypothetical protein
MNKHVAAFIVLDEAIPLLLVEPLHLTLCQSTSLLSNEIPPPTGGIKKATSSRSHLRAARDLKEAKNLNHYKTFTPALEIPYQNPVIATGAFCRITDVTKMQDFFILAAPTSQNTANPHQERDRRFLTTSSRRRSLPP